MTMRTRKTFTLNILKDGVPKDNAVIAVVVAWQVHHVPSFQVCRIVKVLPGHVLVNLRKKHFQAVRTVADGQTHISASPRCSQDLSTKGVDRDDELQVLLQHLMDGVDRKEAAVHGNSKGFNEEVSVSQMRANLCNLGICVAEPELGQEPVFCRVVFRPNGTVGSRRLAQLDGQWNKLVIFRLVIEESHCCGHLELFTHILLHAVPSGWNSLQNLEVHHVDETRRCFLLQGKVSF